MENKNNISRRSAITGMGAICLTTAFTPVLGSDFSSDENLLSSLPEDPKTTAMARFSQQNGSSP